MMDTLYVVMIISFLFCTYRFAKGPSLLDRILALDLMSLLVIGMMILYSIEKDQTPLLDVVWIPAVTSFLSTVILTHFSSRLNSESGKGATS